MNTLIQPHALRRDEILQRLGNPKPKARTRAERAARDAAQVVANMDRTLSMERMRQYCR
jgi:hypothetical protein